MDWGGWFRGWIRGEATQAVREEATKAVNRLQFDLSTAALAQLDDRVASEDMGSRAELIRQALRLYEWVADHRSVTPAVEVVVRDANLGIEYGKIKLDELLRS